MYVGQTCFAATVSRIKWMANLDMLSACVENRVFWPRHCPWLSQNYYVRFSCSTLHTRCSFPFCRKPFWLLHIYLFLDISIQKRGTYIHLLEFEVELCNQRQYYYDSITNLILFMRKYLKIVFTRYLRKSSNHKAGLVSCNCHVLVVFLFECLNACQNFGRDWCRFLTRQLLDALYILQSGSGSKSERQHEKSFNSPWTPAVSIGKQ